MYIQEMVRNELINYSIIIPNYSKSGTQLLERCVNSIPNRDDVEIIIIDNSPLEIDSDLFNSRSNIHVLYSEKGRGAGCARNVGLNFSSGKWLLFADSDDFFTGEINAILDEFRESEYDIVYFKSKGLDSDTLEQNCRGNGYNNLIDRYREYHDSMSEKMLRYYHVVPWGKIIKRSLVIRNSIKFEEVKYSNDVLFATMTGYYAEKIFAEDVIAYCITSRKGSLVTQVSLESRKCRFSVNVRRSKFLWEVHEWQMIPSSYKKMFGIWKQYGFYEFCNFLKIMTTQRTKWYHIIAYEFVHLYYGTIRKLTYHK